MIIFGTRSITSVKRSGGFHCPVCEKSRVFDLKKISRWIHIYFIPVIPLGDQGSYVACRTCQGNFNPYAITEDPGAEQADLIARIDTALVHGLVILAMARPPVTDDVLEGIAALMKRAAGREVDLQKMNDILSLVRRQKLTMSGAMEPLAASLTGEAKVRMLNALLEQRPLSAEQRKLVEKAGQAMKMKKADIAATMSAAT